MEILERDESEPASYPTAPGGLSAAAAALDPSMIWRRIEGYIAHRWTARAVTWTVEGPGCFGPNLAPATIDTVEIWENYLWSSVTLNPSPRGGLILPGSGPYRFTCTVGGGTVPADVNEAFRRLAEYMSQPENHPGASRVSVDIGGATVGKSRDPRWLARAMDNSGAGDLLRNYRRA